MNRILRISCFAFLVFISQTAWAENWLPMDDPELPKLWVDKDSIRKDEKDGLVYFKEAFGGRKESGEIFIISTSERAVDCTKNVSFRLNLHLRILQSETSEPDWRTKPITFQPDTIEGYMAKFVCEYTP